MRRLLPVGFSLLLLSVLATGGYAVDMKPTPIQSQIEAALAPSGDGMLASVDDTWGEESTPTAMVGSDKSAARAGLYSALLPGLGQYYNGQKTKAGVFFAAEVVSWITYGSFRMYGGWKKDDYVQFGSDAANAQLEGKSDEFLDWVGFYDDIDEFNSAGRVGDPDRPYLMDTPENHWHWQSVADREAYRDIKNSSREAYRRSDFLIGLAVVNRVVSALDAVISAGKAARTEVTEWGVAGAKVKLDIDPMGHDRQVSVTVWPGF